jgi:hypothetical protein
MYHTGMSELIPEKVHTKEAHRKKKPSLPLSAIPRSGKNITVYTGGDGLYGRCEAVFGVAPGDFG